MRSHRFAGSVFLCFRAREGVIFLSDSLISRFYDLVCFVGQFFILDNILSSFVGLFVCLGFISLIFVCFWGLRRD